MVFAKFLATARRFSTSPSHFIKVVVCGASGGTGQPLSLLLKTSPLVSKLVLYDIEHTHGVAVDLSHIDTKSEVIGVTEPDKLVEPLQDAQVVVITAGQARKVGMTRADLLETNACVIKSILEPFIQAKSEACIAIITNPVNALVPYAAEILKNAGIYDPKKLFGVTTLDLVRASTFVAEIKKLEPCEVKVPVIGGHSVNTMIPVLSQTEPKVRFSQKEICSLTSKIQDAGNKVIEAKKSGSATLSMAYAAARFTLALCRGLSGEKDVVDTAFVESDVTEARYFSNALKLGKNGIEENLGYGELACLEENLLKEAVPELISDIEIGEKLVCGGE